MRRAIDRSPHSVALRNQWAALARTQGNRDEYLRRLIRAYEVDPQHHPTLYLLAKLHLKNESWRDAAKVLRQALGAAPRQAWVYEMLTIALVNLGRPGEAVHLIRTALPRVDDPSPLHANLALLYLQLGQRRDAENHAHLAIQTAATPEERARLEARLGDVRQREEGPEE